MKFGTLVEAARGQHGRTFGDYTYALYHDVHVFAVSADGAIAVSLTDAPYPNNFDAYVASFDPATGQQLSNKKDVGFEFEKREPKTKKERKPKEPAAKIDFTGKEPLGECPISGGKIFETETSYICEDSQADRKPCKFKLSKTTIGRVADRIYKGLQFRFC